MKNNKKPSEETLIREGDKIRRVRPDGRDGGYFEDGGSGHSPRSNRQSDMSGQGDSVVGQSDQQEKTPLANWDDLRKSLVALDSLDAQDYGHIVLTNPKLDFDVTNQNALVARAAQTQLLKVAEKANELLEKNIKRFRAGLINATSDELQHLLNLPRENFVKEGADMLGYIDTTKDKLIRQGIVKNRTDAIILARNWLRQESMLGRDLKSLVGALGILQVLPDTGGIYGYTAEDLKDPKKNAEAGTRYLADLIRVVRGEKVKQVADWRITLQGRNIAEDEVLKFALAAYNNGPGNVRYKLRKLIKDKKPFTFSNLYELLPKETKKYVTDIMGLKVN